MAIKKYRFVLMSAVLGLLVFAILFACRKQYFVSMPEKEKVYYTNDALVLRKEIGNYFFELKHAPDQSSENDTQEHQYFVLKIGVMKGNDILSEGIGDESEYHSRLTYFDQEAQADMKLVEAGDTLPCLLYHYERNYGIAPFNNIVMTFPNSKTQSGTNDKLFIFEDNILGLGTIKFKLEKEFLKKLSIS
jgi:hypothetical protein